MDKGGDGKFMYEHKQVKVAGCTITNKARKRPAQKKKARKRPVALVSRIFFIDLCVMIGCKDGVTCGPKLSGH